MKTYYKQITNIMKQTKGLWGCVVFVTIFILLIHDYQVEARGGGRGGSRGGRYRSSGGGGGGGGLPWWTYLAIVGGTCILFAFIFFAIYLCKRHKENACVSTE